VIAGYDKDPISPYTRDDRAGELLDEHGRLRALAARLEEEGLEVEPLVVMGATIDKILEVADRIDAGHLVVGSHGRSGLHHLLTGSVTEALLKRSTRPVVVVPVHHR